MTSREEIKEKLVNLLIENSLFPDSEIASIMDEDLINAGLIDSMAFIKLRVLLEEDFNVFIPEKQNFEFYTDVKLKPIRTYVSLLNLWKALGIEFIVNLDQKSPRFRFTRKFWEHYLSFIFRGKELHFEFEVIK